MRESLIWIFNPPLNSVVYKQHLTKISIRREYLKNFYESVDEGVYHRLQPQKSIENRFHAVKGQLL